MDYKTVTLSKGLVKDWKALAKHVSDDKTKYFMNEVYAVDGLFVATDGRTMAYVPQKHFTLMDESVPDGWYRLSGTILVQVPIEGQFPNYKRVIPEFLNTETHKGFQYESSKSANMNNCNRLAWQFGVFCNPEYINRIPEGNYTMYIKTGDSFKAVCFVRSANESRFGVPSQMPITVIVMPMQKPDEFTEVYVPKNYAGPVTA